MDGELRTGGASRLMVEFALFRKFRQSRDI
jgi:hypothetical protein